MTSTEPKDKISKLDESDRCSKGNLTDCGENGIAESEKVNYSPKASSLCNSRNSNSTCIILPSEDSTQVNWKLNIELLYLHQISNVTKSVYSSLYQLII